MAWYRTGNVAITAGQTTVTGTNTAFAANARIGDGFVGPDGREYEITNIASDKVISILPAYQGATVAAGGYAIKPTQGYPKALVDAFNAINSQWGSLLAGLGSVSTENVVPVAKGGTGSANAAGARSNLGLGTAAVAAVTTSATDATAGRLLKVGDFGAGATTPPLLVDFATSIVPPGWYRGFGDGHTSATPNAPPGSGNAAISIFVGSGLNSSYTAYMVIVNLGSTNRVYFGNRASAGGVPVWSQSLNVGDYGIGSYAARITGTELDSTSITPTGFYDVVPSTSTAWALSPFPGGWTRLINISHNNSAGYWTQLAMDFNSNPRIKIRGMSGGSRGDWRELYSQTSVVGSVTMLGGIPSGAVIERGSNANGEYVKFADGTLICWQEASTALVATAAVGNMYQSPGATSWTYPLGFVSAPSVTAYAKFQAGAAQRGWPAVNGISTAQASAVLYAPVVQATSYIGFIAIGRWI